MTPPMPITRDAAALDLAALIFERRAVVLMPHATADRQDYTSEYRHAARQALIAATEFVRVAYPESIPTTEPKQ